MHAFDDDETPIRPSALTSSSSYSRAGLCLIFVLFYLVWNFSNRAGLAAATYKFVFDPDGDEPAEEGADDGDGDADAEKSA